MKNQIQTFYKKMSMPKIQSRKNKEMITKMMKEII